VSASPAGRRLSVLAELAGERIWQDAKWGEQNHPDGTGDDVRLFDLDALPTFGVCARIARNDTDERVTDQRSEWAPILLEEVFEALAEDDPARLRVELVQVAAVAVSWIEAIDRRAGR
jgi:hypothetical protein